MKISSVGLPDAEILHLVTAISRELVCLHEPDGTYIYVSPNSEKIIGYKSEELIGKNPYDYFHPDERRLIQERSHQPILRGEENIHSTFRFLHKDGNYIWLQSDNRLTIHPTTGAKYIHTSSRDISEKIDTEANLATAERRFNTMFHNSPIGLVLTGKNGYIDEANLAFADFLGYQIYEIIGKHFSDISSLDELEENLKFRDEVQKGIIDNYSIEKQYIHKSGNKVWAFITVTVLRDDKGHPIHYLAQIIDIDQRKKNEVVLQKRIGDLQSKSNSLFIQNKQHESYDQIIFHELQKSLNQLNHLLDSIKTSNQFPETKGWEADLLYAVQNLESLIAENKSILQMKSPDSYQCELVDISQTLKNALEQMEGRWKNEAIKVQTEFSKAPTAYLSKDFLEMVFLQLFDNSDRFTHPGRTQNISIESFSDGSQTAISYSDNGTGVDLDQYNDQFFNLNETFRRQMDGRGLGLFLIQSKIESVGGKVEMQSISGEGITFRMYFPNRSLGI
ncbi:PAS domain-containing protein [Leptospira brenneri]|uniref:histidine kinase n=1 Tax=Leptospira brenneri TaxID=2023182 RepID=A0A2M9Y6Y5_9LEPT|nr:PAS domain-containing sensor histidine kinase [Leptospira brenneri]PJZ47335.1 histidine kinase [Leptospira brenneri]TGK95700.1 PAS domain S-box protein [Leptospira brenneri]